MKDNQRPILAFFGHHKCATTWINDIFATICREAGLHHATVSNPEMFDGDLSAYVKQNKVDFLAYVNAEYRYVQQLEHIKGFHVIRDPRDICVSAYFSHAYSHPTKNWAELKAYRQTLQSLPQDEGLLLEIENRDWEFRSMSEWRYARPEIMELKMETLIQNPYRQFLNVARFLGLVDEQTFSLRRRLGYLLRRGYHVLSTAAGHRQANGRSSPRKVPAERVLGIIWENEFVRKTGGRQRGQEDPKSHYRKGVPGDWKEHFQEQHVDRFLELYGDLLIQLGYEKDQRWAYAGRQPEIKVRR